MFKVVFYERKYVGSTLKYVDPKPKDVVVHEYHYDSLQMFFNDISECMNKGRTEFKKFVRDEWIAQNEFTILDFEDWVNELIV